MKRNTALVILHVNDHRIQFCPVYFLNDFVHHVTGSRHIRRHIDSLYLHLGPGRILGNSDDLCRLRRLLGLACLRFGLAFLGHCHLLRGLIPGTSG